MTPELPLRKTGIALGNVTFLVHVALCAGCNDEYGLGARVQVLPEQSELLGAGMPDMMIWQGATLAHAEITPDDMTPDPIDLRCVRVGKHQVSLYREPRLKNVELARWARAYAEKKVTPQEFRRIADLITAGPSSGPARLLREIPAGDVNEGRHLQGRPVGAPGKASTRVRLRWTPRTTI